MTSRNYCFTLFPAQAAEYAALRAAYAGAVGNPDASIIRSMIFQLEVSPTTGRRHLQGYIELFKPARMPQVKAALKSNEVHLETRKGNRDTAVNYCRKEDTRAPDDADWPPGPFMYPNAAAFAEGVKTQGKRNDIDVVFEYAKELAKDKRVCFDDIALAYPSVAVKYANGVRAMLHAINHANIGEMEGELRGWQAELMAELQEPVHPRKIIWYHDVIGNSGKSWMSMYLVRNHGADFYSGGKTVDIAHACTGAPIQVFDFTRSNEGFIPYDAIERLKNGLVFSPKYESGHKIFKTPHVVCFANFAPEEAKLSADRWDLRDLSGL